jgi:hypothetical protein
MQLPGGNAHVEVRVLHSSQRLEEVVCDGSETTLPRARVLLSIFCYMCATFARWCAIWSLCTASGGKQHAHDRLTHLQSRSESVSASHIRSACTFFNSIYLFCSCVHASTHRHSSTMRQSTSLGASAALLCLLASSTQAFTGGAWRGHRHSPSTAAAAGDFGMTAAAGATVLRVCLAPMRQC